MTLEVLRISSRVKILDLVGRHGTHNVRVFGSVARGDCSASSDVDLLVDLQEVLPVPVDVAIERMLRPKVRVRVLLEAVPL